MRSVLPFDEINNAKEAIRKKHLDERGHIKSRKDCEDIIDEMLDVYLLTYAYAAETVNEEFGGDYKADIDEVMSVIDRPIADKTWRERVWEHFDNGGTVEDIDRIIDTETHRDGNGAALGTAMKNGATFKTWVTMFDDRVRDSHTFLEGVTIPIDAEFYTFGGAKALYPGAFGIAEEDCNCRCELIFK